MAKKLRACYATATTIKTFNNLLIRNEIKGFLFNINVHIFVLPFIFLSSQYTISLAMFTIFSELIVNISIWIHMISLFLVYKRIRNK